MNIKINMLDPVRPREEVPPAHWLLPFSALVTLITATWMIAAQYP
ncbi:MAG: hypothetical protein AB1758_24210 [Candidatus Eremiobacterota bacterium]